MGERYSSSDEKCLLLAYYFGRIKLLNCVALQRITRDLIKSFESPPDNHTTKYSEPMDGCCLCEEKEVLFKELLEKHGEGSQPENSDDGRKRDSEKAWTDVSELWKNIIAKKDALNLTEWRQYSAQACQDLIKKHGLKVFGDKECNRANFLLYWEDLMKGIKKKIRACHQSVATINGSASMPSNPGPNVTKWTMRNAYLFLVKKKAARQHAKFMQSCREVGIQIRAAREPVSVLARFTMCTLCTKMGNKHKVVEVPKLLKDGVSYLSSTIAIDEDPDIEPIFDGDEGLKTLTKVKEKADSKLQVWLPVDKDVMPPQNGSILATVRRSDRTPAVKKKNESFLYYANTSITNMDAVLNPTIKKRRASLPTLAPSTSQTVSVESKSSASSLSVSNTSKPNQDFEDNLNVVIVTADGGQLETTLSSNNNIPTHSATPPSDKLNGPNMTPLKIIPANKTTPTTEKKQTMNISPLTGLASTVPQSGIEKGGRALPVQDVQYTSELNPKSKVKMEVIKAAMQCIAHNEKHQPSYRDYCKPVTENFEKKSKVIPITPSSLAQLINSQKSRRVFFFPANSTSSKAIEFKKPAVIPLTLSTSQIPLSRPRSVSLDSAQQKKVFVQNVKPNVPVVTTAAVTNTPVNVPKKSPLFVQIVNGRIQKPGGVKAEQSSVVKSIPLAGNHVKFVKSVSLKGHSGISKNIGDAGKLIPTLGRPDTSGGAIRKTLVLGGSLKQGSIMRVGPSPTKHYRSSTHPQFQLGKSFTFKTVDRSNGDKNSVRGNAPKRYIFTNVPSPHESEPASMPTSNASKKVNPTYLHSPLRTPGKKKHTRPPSKSMSTVVAEHIFSLMPSSADVDLWKKLNTKNKRRSEKSSALIPVPYETNFLCIHDTIERFGWKAYWYWKCRCSKIREKAAETDTEYVEPNPADIAAWVPVKVTDTMKKTLTNYVESEDRIFGVGTSVSSPKDKLAPVMRVLLEDCYPKSDHEQKDEQREEKGGESENIDVETVDGDMDVAESSSSRKRKSTEGSPDQAKKTPTFGIIAKYRKDKNGNWTAMSNLDEVKDSSKPVSEVETLSQSSLDSNALDDVGSLEDSVRLNIQPGLNSSLDSTSSVAMEDRVGSTNDHGLRRCARVTMIRRKELVRRALDAEVRSKVKRDRAENSASEIFLCSSFQYGSLTDPNFSVVTAHPLCFREEQDLFIKVSAAQDKRHQSRQDLLHAKEDTSEVQSSSTEDSIMTLLSSPMCPTLEEKLKMPQSKDSNTSALKTKPSDAEQGKSEKDKPKPSSNVIVRSKVPWEPSAVPSSSKRANSATKIWNLSDRGRKVVNQITPEDVFSSLQVLRGIPATRSPTNVITRWNAEFITKALQGANDKLHSLNPVVVLPAPSVTLSFKNVRKISAPEKPRSPPVESLPSWMKDDANSPKGKGAKNKNRQVAPKVTVSTRSSSESASQSSSSPERCILDPIYEKVSELPEGDTSTSAHDAFPPPTMKTNGVHGEENVDTVETSTSAHDVFPPPTMKTNGVHGEENVDTVETSDDNCLEISIQKVYSLSTQNRSKVVSATASETALSMQCKRESQKKETLDGNSIDSKIYSPVARERELFHSKTGEVEKAGIAEFENAPQNQKSIINTEKPKGDLSENVENFTISDCGLDEVKIDCASKLNHDKVDLEKIREMNEPLKNMENRNSEERNEFRLCKTAKLNKTQEPPFAGDKKTANFVPSLFTIHRDLRTMMKMSKRGNLAHLSLSRTREHSIPFQKHLRRKFKANRNLTTLLGHSYDLKRVASQFKNEVKIAKKRLPEDGQKRKPHKVKRKKSTSNQRPLSNMLNWIWDVNDVENAKLAKFMPVATNVQSLSSQENVSRESTPETTRGPLLSKMTNSATKFKDLLPGGDMGIFPSPQTDEAATPSEVSEVQLLESSPSSPTQTSPRQQRKRRMEGLHSLDGMYWTDLIDYDGADQQLGKNLRRRRILSEEHFAANKEKGNKRKRSGIGFRMSSFDHASDILKVDKESVKKCNREKSTIEWEDEDTGSEGPLRSLFSQALNVDRLRLWIWDSTSPKPMRLQIQEDRMRKKIPKPSKHRHSLQKLTSVNPGSSYSEIVDKSHCDNVDQHSYLNYAASSLSTCFEGHVPQIKRATIPLIRCSVPPEDSDSDIPQAGNRLCLVRRRTRGRKDESTSRPKGLSHHHHPSTKKRKYDFILLFEKMRKDKLQKSLLDDDRPLDAAGAATSESEIVVDVDEGMKPAPIKLEPQTDDILLDKVHASFYGPPRADDIVIEHYLPGRKNRYYPRKKSESRYSENGTTATKISKQRKRRGVATLDDPEEEAKLQALRETIFKELKREGNFKEKHSTPDSAKSGVDRRRPLLQSRCSTKGGFISRLVECDAESVISNDAVKT